MSAQTVSNVDDGSEKQAMAFSGLSTHSSGTQKPKSRVIHLHFHAFICDHSVCFARGFSQLSVCNAKI